MALEADSLIFMLNDDCLLRVFSFLPVNEQLLISRMSHRLEKVFEVVLRTCILEIDYLTLEDIAYIFFKFGHAIKKIKMKGSYVHITYALFYISDCSDLLSLDISNSSIELFEFGPFRNLTSITLKDCNIIDYHLSILSKWNRLEYLDVSWNTLLTGVFMEDFNELTDLNISYCVRIKLRHFLKFCYSNRALRSLNIMGCFNSDHERENIIDSYSGLNSLVNLENLTLSTRESAVDTSYAWIFKRLEYVHYWCTICCLVNPLRKFPELSFTKLKTLKIGGKGLLMEEKAKDILFSMKTLKRLCFEVIEDLYDEDLLRIAAMPQLITFEAIFCSSLSNTGLLHLFQKPNKLENLDISGNTVFDNGTVVAIIDKITEMMRETHLTLNLRGTSVTALILETTKYKEKESLLKLKF